MRPFKLTEAYTAPKGSFIIPDIVAACHQGFTNGKEFDPDRFRWGVGGIEVWVEGFSMRTKTTALPPTSQPPHHKSNPTTRPTPAPSARRTWPLPPTLWCLATAPTTASARSTPSTVRGRRAARVLCACVLWACVHVPLHLTAVGAAADTSPPPQSSSPPLPRPTTNPHLTQLPRPDDLPGYRVDDGRLDQVGLVGGAFFGCQATHPPTHSSNQPTNQPTNQLSPGPAPPTAAGSSTSPPSTPTTQYSSLRPAPTRRPLPAGSSAAGAGGSSSLGAFFLVGYRYYFIFCFSKDQEHNPKPFGLFTPTISTPGRLSLPT
jgi:hypothetical protein